MSQTITAIYEDGVLKPEFPLELDERQQVQVTIQPMPMYMMSPENRVQALEQHWRERTPIFPSAPRPSRDELHDRR